MRLLPGYLDAVPLYLEEDPRHPTQGPNDMTYMLQLHTVKEPDDPGAEPVKGKEMSLPVVVPSNPDAMWSRWLDFVFLGGVKCAIDLVTESTNSALRQLALTFVDSLPHDTWPSPAHFERAKASIIGAATPRPHPGDMFMNGTAFLSVQQVAAMGPTGDV